MRILVAWWRVRKVERAANRARNPGMEAQIAAMPDRTFYDRLMRRMARASGRRALIEQS